MTIRNTQCIWLELVSVQVAPSLASQLATLLLDIAEAINLDKEVSAQVYIKPDAASEASIHLLHTTSCSGRPSPLGLRIAGQIAELGAVAHSVWEPRTNTSLMTEDDQ